MLILLLGLVGVWLRWRGQLYQQRQFLWFAMLMGPAGLVALIAGWMTTEIGRQPWVVYGVMRTADAVTHHTALTISISLLVFVLLYCTVFGTGIGYMLKLMAQIPERGPPPADIEDPSRRPARPLSAAPDFIPASTGKGA
jgi:cytochrome d ubiquinol oxidase subunit I